MDGFPVLPVETTYPRQFPSTASGYSERFSLAGVGLCPCCGGVALGYGRRFYGLQAVLQTTPRNL